MLDEHGLPLLAILRGLSAADAPAVGRVLLDAGFRLLEVPLNRPGAVDAIAALVRMAPSDAVIGGGTMLGVEDVDQVAAAGGRMFVAPDCRPAVIAHARRSSMFCVPGVATPTEAFAALAAGADALKLFPAQAIGQAGLKALRTVLPPDTRVWPVGGIDPAGVAAWRSAGASGLGIGEALYTPGIDAAELARRARAFAGAWQACGQ